MVKKKSLLIVFINQATWNNLLHSQNKKFAFKTTYFKERLHLDA